MTNNRQPTTIVFIAIALAIVFIVIGSLSGCAATKAAKPFAEVSLGYAIPSLTDYWQQSERTWQCEPPQFRGKAGWEFPGRLSVAVYHESMVLCGTINKKPEIYENGIEVTKRWGGY